jgi:hypothetical protein
MPSTIPVSSNARNTSSHRAGQDGPAHLVRVLGLGVDGSDEADAVSELVGPEDLLGGPHRILDGQERGTEEPVGHLGAPVDEEVVVSLTEDIHALLVGGEGEVHDHHRGDDEHLVDAHQVHLLDTGMRVDGAVVVDVGPLLVGERDHRDQLAHDLLVHLGSRDADRVVRRREVAVAATHDRRGAVQPRAPPTWIVFGCLDGNQIFLLAVLHLHIFTDVICNARHLRESGW